MKRPEQDLQRACVRYMRYAYPKVLCFHVPNEGVRDRTRGAILKGLGVVAGVPDLLIVQPKQMNAYSVYCGLAIELKATKGTSTAIQLAVQDQFKYAGWIVKEIRDFDTFKETVDRYLGKPVDPILASGNDRVQLTEG